jgi:hypothetical protein
MHLSPFITRTLLALRWIRVQQLKGLTQSVLNELIMGRSSENISLPLAVLVTARREMLLTLYINTDNVMLICMWIRHEILEKKESKTKKDKK